MNFLISDTFTGSLAQLSNEEQKQVKITVFDLQTNPESSGLSFHKLDRARDKNFWSVRVSGNLRVIVHRTKDSLLLCYADRHEKAYAWAERRKLTVHPATGAAQLVEIYEKREKAEEITTPKNARTDASKSLGALLFSDVPDESLLEYGVPVEWLADVREADEDRLLALSDHLPAEAMEALLEIACGGTPAVRKSDSPFNHPDAQRRFRFVSTREELERALELPWEKWLVFLHPDQSEIVTKHYLGPARVSGSAGTGKTVVALHRAVWLARANPEARVLLTTFSDVLANSLLLKRNQLLLQTRDPLLSDRIDVASLDAIALRLYRLRLGNAKLASGEELKRFIDSAAEKTPGHSFTKRFLYSEWEQVVDARQVKTRDGYFNAPRLGRKTRLTEKNRELLWLIFGHALREMDAHGLLTISSVFAKLADYFMNAGKLPFEHIVVDEAQDLGIQQLLFLSALAGAARNRENALFFAGDLGQRIFQQPFSWKSLGIDVRGRSKTLRVNYRTSHQIRMRADRLLDRSVSDVDGNVEKRDDAVSLFNGPEPSVILFAGEKAEQKYVADWIGELLAEGVRPHEIGIFVRSECELQRASDAASLTGAKFVTLDHNVEVTSGHLALGTMHLAKGLEFKAVAVMACDEAVLPLESRIAGIGDEADLKEVYDTERHLFYVACTRARERLLVTGTQPGSEFIEDLKKG
jgi:superfamily I DNA/RNA helicase/mRNA-degrading endonuclease RelE of RelBE toxin-antitoxin system